MRWHTEQQQQCIYRKKISLEIYYVDLSSLVSLNTHLDSEVPT